MKCVITLLHRSESTPVLKPFCDFQNQRRAGNVGFHTITFSSYSGVEYVTVLIIKIEIVWKKLIQHAPKTNEAIYVKDFLNVLNRFNPPKTRRIFRCTVRGVRFSNGQPSMIVVMRMMIMMMMRTTTTRRIILLMMMIMMMVVVVVVIKDE